MTCYAPAYYPRFACIADRCRHSCCIGWEIDVDEDTLQLYDALTGGYGEVIAASIEGREECPHFCLGQGERCPHLNERGLCRIILTLGEDYLCDICREHPRFYHQTPHGREVGLGMACEEACRLILTSEDGSCFVAVDEDDEDAPAEVDFDATAERARIYEILADATRTYAQQLSDIEQLWGAAPTALTEEESRELLRSLEYMNEDNRARFAMDYRADGETPDALTVPLRRALIYFIFRHASAAESREDFAAALCLCLFLERLLCSLATSAAAYELPALIDVARTLSEEIEYSEDNTAAIREALRRAFGEQEPF